MKRQTLFLLICFFIAGCAKSTEALLTESDIMNRCKFILIKGPAELNVGQKAVFEAVPFDEGNNLIKCSNVFCPDWSIDDEKIVTIERVNKSKLTLRAVKEGKCYIWLYKGNIVTSYLISVK